MKEHKDWIVRYFSEHEDDEEDGVIIQELVRCKDCKFNPKKIILGCPMAGSMSRNDDSFCSVGKRRKTKGEGSLCAFPKEEMVDDDG